MAGKFLPSNSSPLKCQNKEPDDVIPAPDHWQRSQPAKPVFKISRNSTLMATNQDNSINTMLNRFKEAKLNWAAEKGQLHLKVKKHAQRTSQAENELKRTADRANFLSNKVNHLQVALKRRDDDIEVLKDHIRELEQALSSDEGAKAAIDKFKQEQGKVRESVDEEVSEMGRQVAIMNELANAAVEDAETTERQAQTFEKALRIAQEDIEHWKAHSDDLAVRLARAHKTLTVFANVAEEARCQHRKRVDEMKHLILQRDHDEESSSEDEEDDVLSMLRH